MSAVNVLKRIDAEVDDFMRRTRYFKGDITVGRAYTYVKQHRLNTRQRNSVLKLRVATNCPDWDTKLQIIKACTQEIIADNEYGRGKPHWQILEDLGVEIGLPREEIRAAEPLLSTRICWAAWEGLMSHTDWLEGIVANTCAERANVPGYGEGMLRERGWCGLERHRYNKLFGLRDDQMEFFDLHSKADLEHSDMGWRAVARSAEDYRMEDAVVNACRLNLGIGELYLDGIAAEGDRIDARRKAV